MKWSGYIISPEREKSKEILKKHGKFQTCEMETNQHLNTLL